VSTDFITVIIIKQ